MLTYTAGIVVVVVVVVVVEAAGTTVVVEAGIATYTHLQLTLQ